MIARFETSTKQWQKLGELNQARHGHGVIIHQGEFVVVGGGVGTKKTESCALNGDSIQCVAVEPRLNLHDTYPEVMSVPESFCLK